MACLATHSHWARNIENNVSGIRPYFHLTNEDERILMKWMRDYGKKIVNASIIMEEKRWRKMLHSMKYLPKIIGENLKLWWFDYLGSFQLTDVIPKTSLHESICFIQYLLNQAVLTDSTLWAAKFELQRNITLAYDLATLEMESEWQNVQGFKAILNPSFSMQCFNHMILGIISEVSSDGFNHENVYLAFYKNRITGMVCVVKMSEILRWIVSKVPDSPELSTLISVISNTFNIKYESVLSLIRTMVKNDVIAIEKRKSPCLSNQIPI